MKKKLQFPSLRKIGVHLALTVTLLLAGMISNVLPVAASPKVTAVSVAGQTGTLTAGTPSSVTYVVSVTKANAGAGSNNVTANLSVTGLPAGASGSFNPATLSWTTTQTGVKTSTLTINTTAAASVGTTSFTVTAVRSTSPTDSATGNGALVIGAPVAGAPVITFGPAPAPTYPGANFTVNATSNSNGALSYSVASGPCVVVNSTLGSFSPSATGTCVIQANTTATLNFAAGSNQLNVTVMAGVAGPASSCPCDLWAKQGTLTLPDATNVNIYGYSATAAGAAGLPGPTLTVNQGEAVAITLHNVDLPGATSLFIAEQAIPADPVGVTAGNSTIYSIPAGVLQPGTYLYEAGLTADGPRQVAMGLFGALIVRPAGAVASTQAYADANSAFVDQVVLVLSEIDPAFNANPATFDMTQYAPKYWLINGKGYPNTDPIPVTTAGNSVLLRYLNAGLLHHSMGLIGLHQTIIAADGKTVTNPTSVVADTIPAGTTLDTIVTVPVAATANAKYALLDAAMHTDNKGILDAPPNANAAYTPITFGGMLTFLTVGSGTTTGGGAPVTSNVTLSPNPTSGPGGNVPGPVTLSATFAGAPDRAEYFVDTIGTSGVGCALSGSAASIPVAGATAPCADLTTLPSGNHTFYVHGHNANGWGAVAAAVLTLDTLGPAISGLSLSPNPANGSADVALQATANDGATGNQNVTTAEYTIDGGTAVGITPNNPATVVSLNAAIPAATVAGLANGNHTIAVRAQDALGNWGTAGTVTLVVDKTGPTTSGVSTTPNPTNGTNGVQVSTGGAFYQRIDATISDVTTGNQNVVAAEYFIDTVGANGTGGVMLATAGTFKGNNVTVYAAVDLYAIVALANGPHTICVRGEDAAGNWGPCATTTLTVDKVAPTLSNVVVNPNTPNSVVVGAVNVPLNATATDAASAIVAAEYFIDTDPGQGLATPITTGLGPSPANLVALLNGLTAGNHTIGMRARDAAGNWSAVASVTVAVQNPLFANSFPNSNSPYGWSSVGGTTAQLSLSSAANNIRDANTRSLQAGINSNTSGYVAHTLPSNPAVTSYHARFYVNPNGAALGTTAPTIFSAINGTTTILQVQMRLTAGQYQVCATSATACGTTGWVTITGATAIEVVRNGTTLTVYVGGVLQGTPVTVVATNITAERLGLQGTLPATSTNPLRLDAFISTRTAYIGP